MKTQSCRATPTMTLKMTITLTLWTDSISRRACSHTRHITPAYRADTVRRLNPLLNPQLNPQLNPPLSPPLGRPLSRASSPAIGLQHETGWLSRRERSQPCESPLESTREAVPWGGGWLARRGSGDSRWGSTPMRGSGLGENLDLVVPSQYSRGK